MRLVLTMLILAALVAGRPAGAEPELHVVSVAAGNADLASGPGIPGAEVVVDRPGARVILLLLDRGPVQWRVEATDDTALERIIIGGTRPEASELLLWGHEVGDVAAPGIPFAYRPLGLRFRTLIEALPEATGVAVPTSFHGVSRAPALPIMVDGDSPSPAFAADYLRAHLSDPDKLPPDFGRWLAGWRPDAPPEVGFDETGVRVTLGETLRDYPVTPGVPPPVGPVAAALDPVGNAVYAVSLGGVGHLYRIDLETGEWRVLRELRNYDPAALFLDVAGRRLVLTGAHERPGEIWVIGLDGSARSFTVPTPYIPGMTDLYDYGNESAPILALRLLRGEWLLAEARGHPGTGAANHHRTYAINLALGTIRLIAYRNGDP